MFLERAQEQATEKVPAIQRRQESKLQPRKKYSSRYTADGLQSACESFKESQQSVAECQKEKIASLNRIAKAMEDHNALYQKKVEADQTRSKAELIIAKIEYFKAFGNVNDFDKFL